MERNKVRNDEVGRNGGKKKSKGKRVRKSKRAESFR